MYRNDWALFAETKVIATNKTEKPIAIEFYPNYHILTPMRPGWKPHPAKRGARLILLPVADRYNVEPQIEFLLNQIHGSEKTQPPSWVSEITVPGEASLKSNIVEQQQIIEQQHSKLNDLENRLEEVQSYKDLLFESGPKLQSIVKHTLSQLGAEIKPSVVTDEFIISIKGKDALIEVKGNGKSINKGDLGQLITDIGEHVTETGEEIQGILIGNAWRLLPLNDRGTKDKPIFPRNIVSIAENRNIGLISTTEIFKAFCYVLEKPEFKDEILQQLINGRGIISINLT